MSYRENIRPYIELELEQSKSLEAQNDLEKAFHHLERAHVLGQQDTYWHIKIHQEMLRLAAKQGDGKEIAGQLLRIVGASTKTPLGIYPTGNTGGANVSPVKPMPIPNDLQILIDTAKRTKA
jgi:Protein of unknown function (DUF3703)